MDNVGALRSRKKLARLHQPRCTPPLALSSNYIGWCRIMASVANRKRYLFFEMDWWLCCFGVRGI
jgi:hypothetical protein